MWATRDVAGEVACPGLLTSTRSLHDFWLLPSSRRNMHIQDGVRPPLEQKKERKKTDKPREGWEDGTPPPHRDFKVPCPNK